MGVVGRVLLLLVLVLLSLKDAMADELLQGVGGSCKWLLSVAPVSTVSVRCTGLINVPRSCTQVKSMLILESYNAPLVPKLHQ